MKAGTGRPSGRDRILSRVREAVASRDAVDHPGPFSGWRPGPPDPSTLDAFEARFRAAGGEAQRVSSTAEAARWVERHAASFASVTLGRGVPEPLCPTIPTAPPRDAALGISMARGAVAETGSLILDARDGRRTQLLAPEHVVVVGLDTVHATLRAALASLRSDLPSAIGFHSGPSKSADIGQVMVKGVHGPGRVIALIVDRLD